MAITFTYSSPHFEDGVPLEIGGIGVVPNNDPVVLETVQEEHFYMQQGETVADRDLADALITTSGTETYTPE